VGSDSMWLGRACAMHHRLQWFIDQQPTHTPYTLYLYLYVGNDLPSVL